MTSSKLKIAVLYDVPEEEAQAPPPEPEPEKAVRRKTKKKVRKTKKEKHDREEIFEALGKLGHEPSYQILDGRNQSLTALAKCSADMVFNLVESYGGDDTKDTNVAAYLDLVGMPYTGSGPHGLFLAQDKSIAKKLFAFYGVNTPFFAMSFRGRLDHSHDIKFPLS